MPQIMTERISEMMMIIVTHLEPGVSNFQCVHERLPRARKDFNFLYFGGVRSAVLFEVNSCRKEFEKRRNPLQHLCPLPALQAGGGKDRALALSIVRALQAGVLSKEREAKFLKIGFIFDDKQEQIVHDDYLAGRLPLSARHSDDEGGKSRGRKRA
jgi:hypothetical protein